MPFPYTFPFTFDISDYYVLVDWNNDGDFTDTYDDISADLIDHIHYSRGKSSELGKAEVGQLSITLNNATGKYTPSNAAGVLYLSLLPKRPIKVTYGLPTTYPLFYGFIEEIIPHPHLTEQDCIITAVDGLDFLSRHDMATALYKNALTGTIHGYILDDAGWSASMRTLDAGQDTVPYWYGSDVKARFAQEEIDDSEQGFSYVDGSGNFRFEDRYHRSTATHQTSQATFNNTMEQITYSLNPKNVFNIVKVTVTPWTLQASTELWRLQEIPSIPTGETMIWWGDASVSGIPVFVDEWVTPGQGIEILRPNAAGDETNITYQFPATGAHWDKVDEAVADDGDYIQENSVAFWKRDLYNLPSVVTTVGVISKIKVYVRARGTQETGDRTSLKIAIKTGGTAYEDTERTLTWNFLAYSNEWATNPNTGIAWTIADINALQIGVSLRAPDIWGSESSIVSQVYVEITSLGNADYTANSLAAGGGVDMTADIGLVVTKFAKTIKLALTNNGTVPAFITLLKARGTYYDDQTQVTLKAEDSTSQTAYQKRTLEIDGKYMTDATRAQSLSSYALGKFKDPRAELGMGIMNQDATTLTQILSRELSDRISIYNDKLGLNVPIDVGSDAIDRALGMSVSYTRIDLANPITINGTITSIDVWADSNITGFRVGIFYLVSGTTYTCRSSITIGNVTAGSKQTFPVSLTAQIGDFIGCYGATGTIEQDTSGGTNVYYATGEFVDPGDSTVYTQLGNNRAISLYGSGTGGQDFFIDYMEHDISNGGLLHTVTYRLADCSNEDFWSLDFSILSGVTTSGQTKLGY